MRKDKEIFSKDDSTFCYLVLDFLWILLKTLLFSPFERRELLVVADFPTRLIIFHHPDNKEIMQSSNVLAPCPLNPKLCLERLTWLD